MFLFVARSRSVFRNLFVLCAAAGLMVVNFSAHAEGAPPAPGKPGDPIVVDVSTDAATVQLPGVEARLVAVVSPTIGVFTVQGPAYATNAITGYSASLINAYCATKNAKDAFAVSVELRRASGYTDLLDVFCPPDFATPKQASKSVRARNMRTAGDNIDSATTLFALLDLSLRAVSQPGKFDLATTVIYGPAFDESLDLPLGTPKDPLRFMGIEITPTVLRLPATDPATAPTGPNRPAVMLLFDPPKALPGFEVQAIRADDKVVRAHNQLLLFGTPRDGKAQWDFGTPGPISKASITKFVFRGYRVQPIVWKNIALPPGIAAAK